MICVELREFEGIAVKGLCALGLLNKGCPIIEPTFFGGCPNLNHRFCPKIEPTFFSQKRIASNFGTKTVVQIGTTTEKSRAKFGTAMVAQLWDTLYGKLI